jgi:putative drug exporter of the RND superfamily
MNRMHTRRQLLSSLTRWVLAHKRIVVVTWLLLTVAGIAASGPASKALDQKFSVPGKEGWETNVAIMKHYGGTGGDSNPLVPVVTLPKGRTVRSSGVKAELARIDGRLHKALPGARIASYASTADRAFVSKGGRTTFALVWPRPDPDSTFGDNAKAEQAARAAIKDSTVAGRPVHLTGFDALQQQTGGSDGPGVFLEALLGGAGALLVLAFVFASLLAIVALMTAVVSIMTTFLLPLGLTKFVDVRRSCSS